MESLRLHTQSPGRGIARRKRVGEDLIDFPLLDRKPRCPLIIRGLHMVLPRAGAR